MLFLLVRLQYALTIPLSFFFHRIIYNIVRSEKEVQTMPVYKDEKRGSWFTSFYYNDANGEKKRKKKEGFKTRKDALEYERDFSLQSDSGPKILFEDLLSLYIEDCQTRLRPTTMKGKNYILKTKIM